MRHLGLITISAAILSFGLTLGAAPQEAWAGACSKIRGVPNQQCISRRDIKRNAINSARLANNAKPAGADFAGGDQLVALGEVDVVIRAVTITAPAAGVVIVNASGHFQSNGVSGTARCSITTANAIPKLDFTALILASVGPGDDNFESIAGTRGFEVAAGLNAFNLVCDEFAGNVSVIDTQLTAMYVPRRY